MQEYYAGAEGLLPVGDGIVSFARNPSASVTYGVETRLPVSAPWAPADLQRPDRQTPNYAFSSASAPLVMSRISIVMAFWRARLYSSVRSSISSSALEVALSMATIRAPCSAAFDSRRARQVW